MGLIDRLRPGRDRQTPVPDSTPQTPPLVATDADIIRASSLRPPVGAWAYIPPLATVLQEMPLVVPPHFEERLAARRPPQQFLAPLGHAVTETSPSGAVDGVAVLTPIEPALALSLAETPLPARPVVPPVDLPLANPTPTLSGPTSEVRRLPHAQLYGLGLVPDLAPTGVQDLALPTPPRSAGPVLPSYEPPPDTEPTVALEAPVSHPLLSAGAPSDLPLASLPATPLPPELQDLHPPQPVNPTGSTSGPTDGAQTGLIGDRTPVDGRSDPGLVPSGPARIDRPVRPEAGSAELPLASPESGRGLRPGPGGEAPIQPQLPVPAGHREAEAPAVTSTEPTGGDHSPALEPPEDPLDPATPAAAPLLGQGEPIVEVREALAGPAAHPGGTSPGSGPAVDLPLAGPVGTGADAALSVMRIPGTDRAGGPDQAAGDAGPGPSADEPPALPPASERPARRSGLGEPLAGLPPTARSYDITSLSRGEQLQVSRAILQNRMASTSLPLAVPPDDAARTGAAPRGAASTGGGQGGPTSPATALPVARVQSYGSPQQGTLPEGLVDSVDDMAPLLGMDPLASPDYQVGTLPMAAPLEGASVRAEVGRLHGVDLTTVPVDRSVAGAAEANRLGARAFTSDRGVVIPARVGTLEAGEGAALLAHELTHVAQRQRFGAAVPEEATPQGRRLEAEARQAEMVYARGGQGMADTSLPERTGPPTWSGRPGTNEFPGVATAAPVPATMPLVTAPPAGPDADTIALTVLERLTTMSPGSQPHTEVFTAAGASASPAAAPIQRAADPLPPPTPSEPSRGEVPPPAGMTRPSDEDLSNLSRWLYPLIRYRLKRELREERERSGLLTDHYRRW